MTDDNIASIVKVPDTFFKNNIKDEIALFDDPAKIMFHLFKKHQRMYISIIFFYVTSSISHHFLINNRSNVFGHSFKLHVYGVFDLSVCVDDLAITNVDTCISFETEVEYEQMK